MLNIVPHSVTADSIDNEYTNAGKLTHQPLS